MNKTILCASSMVLALASGAALAQAPAQKPSQPAVCSNCHKPAPGEVGGYFESVSYKSQAILLGIDADREIIRFDPKPEPVRLPVQCAWACTGVPISFDDSKK